MAGSEPLTSLLYIVTALQVLVNKSWLEPFSNLQFTWINSLHDQSNAEGISFSSRFPHRAYNVFTCL